MKKEFSIKLESLYAKYENKIRRLYKQPLFWHGTGLFQYLPENKNIEDVFNEIIKNNGLIPQRKRLRIETGQGSYKTLSLSKLRMYASIYANIHLDESKRLQFLWHSRFFWLSLIILRNFVNNPIKIVIQTLLYSFSKGQEQIFAFQSRIRKPKNLRNSRIFILQYLYLSIINSDIKGNYPILIAIKNNELDIQKKVLLIDMYEVRTEKQISFEDISHIEVPLFALRKAINLLKRSKKSIEVLPIEICELYLKRNYKVRDLLEIRN